MVQAAERTTPGSPNSQTERFPTKESTDNGNIGSPSLRPKSPHSQMTSSQMLVQSIISAVTSMYSVPLPADVDVAKILARYYSDAAVFSGPLVSLATHPSIAATFEMVGVFFRYCALELEGVTPLRQTADERFSFSMHSHLVCIFPLLPDRCALKFRVSTDLVLDRWGKILSHTDHWSIGSLLGALPLFSFCLRLLQRVVGMFLAYAYICLCFCQSMAMRWWMFCDTLSSVLTGQLPRRHKAD